MEKRLWAIWLLKVWLALFKQELIAKTRKLSVTALRSLARLLLRLLVFLHRFPLFLSGLFRVLLLLLGRSAGLASVFSDTPVFPLSMGRYRHCNTQSE